MDVTLINTIETKEKDAYNPHIMSVNPEEEHSKSRCVDDTQTIRLSRLKWQRGIFVESNRGRRPSRYRLQILPVLREVD